MIRKIEKIYKPNTPHFVGDGFRVHHFIPGLIPMERMNPFIMMDYNAPHYFSPSLKSRGVGVHPHRGFETVTIAYQGKVEHHDSSGGGGIIHEGDVQWMTAASGVLHKEYHEKNWSKQGGVFQMVQLWINLPAKHKMSKPKYQAIKRSEMPFYTLPNKMGVLTVIAGNYVNLEGKASTFTPIHMYDVELQLNSSLPLDFPAHFVTALLVIEGSVLINESEVAQTNHLVLMENNAEIFTLKALEYAKILVLSAEPIDEPIAAHGPFVMNTHNELMQAFNDFNNGKFGNLAD